MSVPTAAESWARVEEILARPGPNFTAAVDQVRKIVERDQFEHHIVPMYVPRQPAPDGCYCDACVPGGGDR